MKDTQHIISFSGGKDSTALVLLAMEAAERKGFVPQIVFADTGHEHPLTYEYVENVERHTGLTIRRVRADFTKDIERKRRFIAEKWADDGVPRERIDRALEVLKPTGNPFLDLCLWKGRFPSTRARFCSEELKHHPIMRQVQMPAAKLGPVLSWQGVRADESASRRNLPRYDRGDFRTWNYRPILHWTVDDVFAMHRRHGLEPNPLYRLGMGRVGCMPCIHARKAELAEIARRFPEELERVAEWERLVTDASKWGMATFRASCELIGAGDDVRHETHGIMQFVEWAKTSRGGKQYDLEAFMPPETCSSIYGLCE